MKKDLYLFLVFIGFFVAVEAVQSNDMSNSLLYVDFNESMQLDTFSNVLFNPDHVRSLLFEGELIYQFFHAMYKKSNFLYVSPQKETRIPKIIHQIWIGKEVPQELKSFQESWKKHHPDWEYKLWTQHDIPSMSLQNRDLIDATSNPSQKADLLGFEILYQYGGVYIDMDMECLQPLDVLHHTYDFYTGMQPLDTEYVQLGYGIVGTIPKHPILKRCIELVREGSKRGTREDINMQTGPHFFTWVVILTLGRNDDTIDVVLPAHYFYPLGSKEYDLKKEEWLQQGAFTVHYWAKTWLLPAFRRPEFQNIKNF